MLLLCKKIRMITIIHNPRCGKSREGLAILEQSGKPFQVIKYLDKNPTEAELKAIIQKLQLAPIDLVRQKESVWIEQFKGKNLSDTDHGFKPNFNRKTHHNERFPSNHWKTSPKNH